MEWHPARKRRTPTKGAKALNFGGPRTRIQRNSTPFLRDCIGHFPAFMAISRAVSWRCGERYPNVIFLYHSIKKLHFAVNFFTLRSAVPHLLNYTSVKFGP